MTIEIIHYTGEKYSIKNATAIDFDGETGELHVQGDMQFRQARQDISHR